MPQQLGCRDMCKIWPDHIIRMKVRTKNIRLWAHKPFVKWASPIHYSDVIMSTMACQITSLTIFYSIVYLGADQRKQKTSKVLPFDDVIMQLLIRIHFEFISMNHIHTYFVKISNQTDVLKTITTTDPLFEMWCNYITLQWRHDKCHGVSNHRRLGCLFNRLYWCRWKKTIKAPRHWPLWWESTADRCISLTTSR